MQSAHIHLSHVISMKPNNSSIPLVISHLLVHQAVKEKGKQLTMKGLDPAHHCGMDKS